MVSEKLYAHFLETSGVCTDTRTIHPDCLFIALKGQNFNGNTFASEALSQGARYAVVDEPEYQIGPNILLVDDCLLFLQQLAHHHRRQFDIPVIGITGSNGKTSSKELIHAALSASYKTLATVGNLNNHIGVPLTLLRLDASHEIAIIEMGANKPGDIAELCEIAEPDFGIITNIGKAHLEGFGNFDGVLQTKTGLYRSVAKREGELIVNGDDPVLMQHLPTGISRVITYGKGADNDIRGNLLGLSPFINMSYTQGAHTSGALSMQMIGDYNFYNYLAAIAFGYRFNVPSEKLERALQDYVPQNNRSQVKKTAANTLILDCYNANPSSMRSALTSFAAIEHANKFFIIGDMLELGAETEPEHRAILSLCRELQLEGITVGRHFREVSPDFSYPAFETKSEALAYLNSHTLHDRLILLKGSRGIGLESLQEHL